MAHRADQPRAGDEPPKPLDRTTMQRMVFETFGRRRFLQDSPIRPDVWFRAIAIADRTAIWRITGGQGKPPNALIDVLVTPVAGKGPGLVAETMRRRFDERLRDQKEPPGPEIVRALVSRHVGIAGRKGLERPDSDGKLDDALTRVAEWAGLPKRNALAALYRKVQEPLQAILPDGQWQDSDELRAAVRYALQKVVEPQHAWELFGQRQNIAQGMREVAASLSFPHIYWHVLPLTAWWRSLPEAYRRRSDVRKAIEGEVASFSAAAGTRMTAAEYVSSRPNPEYYRVTAVAAFIMGLWKCRTREDYRHWREVADVLAPAMPQDADEDDPLFDPLVPGTKSSPLLTDEHVIRLLRLCAEMELPDEESKGDEELSDGGEDGLIWAIQCNRRASAPQANAGGNQPSHATIKADAARRLFDLSTRTITWAVIDTGIDLRHAAFRVRPPKDGKPKGGEPKTRIDRVLDFGLLRAIMSERVMPEDLPSWPKDEGQDTEKVSARKLDKRRKILAGIDFIMRRNRLARELDWDIVAPLIERPADPDDPCWEAPTSDHGTHVAGVLAGDWHFQQVENPVVASDVRARDDKTVSAEEALAQENKPVVAGDLRVEQDKLVLADTSRARENTPSLVGDLRVQEYKPIFVGVCPDIHLIDLRVFGGDRPSADGDADGSSNGASTEYAILAAIEFVGWLNRTRETPVVHGVNLSLAVPHRVDAYACGQTPVCRACNGLSANGTVVVAAAGNSGFEFDAGKLSRGDGYRGISISDPGNAEEVITVGATHARDPHTFGVSYFSGRGPTGDGRRKPDIVAPGERILSAILWAPKGEEAFEPGSEAVGERLDCKDGTSMAAPHVSGAAALLMARHRELIGQPRRIKQILMRTATDLGRDPVFQGAGLVDVLRALQSV